MTGTPRVPRKKDPRAPKRPLSAYMFFSSEQRSKIEEANPGLKLGEMGRRLGTEWRSLPAAARQRYAQKAEQDKERYEAEMLAYQNGA